MVSPMSPGLWILSELIIPPVACLKVTPGIQKFQNPVCCWSNGTIQCVENCIDERRDYGQIKLFCLKTFAELGH